MEPPAHTLCVSIIRNASQIKDRLQSAERWDDFRERISQWSDEWLDRRPFETEPTTQALVLILEEFRLRELLDTGASISVPRVRGSVVRTQAHTSASATPPALLDEFRQVAQRLS